MIELPSWDECAAKWNNDEEVSAIEIFILEQTPGKCEEPDKFEQHAQDALNEAYELGRMKGQSEGRG